MHPNLYFYLHAFIWSSIASLPKDFDKSNIKYIAELNVLFSYFIRYIMLSINYSGMFRNSDVILN